MCNIAQFRGLAYYYLDPLWCAIYLLRHTPLWGPKCPLEERKKFLILPLFRRQPLSSLPAPSKPPVEYISSAVSPQVMIRTRRIVFTYNNYPSAFDDDDSLDAWLDSIGAKYIIAGREIAPSTDTPHLQGYCQFAHAKSLSAFRKLFPGCHVESANGTAEQCRKYCIKDGRYRERGDAPVSSGVQERERWENARSLAKAGNFDDIPADIYVRYIGNLERIYRSTLPAIDPLPDTCGIWLVGPTGSGKSRGVRDKYPLVYPKPLNKWWDGYSDQDFVLLDDVDMNQSSWIGNFLKIWADHYPFIGEKKGGSRLIRPKSLIVTSQYLIENIFQDEELVLALKRRFIVINVNKDEAIVWP